MWMFGLPDFEKKGRKKEERELLRIGLGMSLKLIEWFECCCWCWLGSGRDAWKRTGKVGSTHSTNNPKKVTSAQSTGRKQEISTVNN